MFGNDIKANICTFVTFADGQDPPVLKAMKEAIPYFPLFSETWFKFDNSAVYANKTETSQQNFAPLNMGIESCSRFFEYLNTLHPKNLELTSKVILCRNEIANVQKEKRDGESKIKVLANEIQTFTKYSEQIKKNTDFTFDVEEIRKTPISLETPFTTTCMTCNMTCHENCKISQDLEKDQCWAMKDGFCTQCPHACYWKKHKNTPYILKTIKVTKSYGHDRSKGNEKRLTQDDLIEKMQAEYQYLNSQNQDLQEVIRKLNDRLKNIALRAKPH